MTKLFVIVKPAYTFKGIGRGDVPGLLFGPVHRVVYGHICGFSLGREVEFYDTLEGAQSEFSRIIAADNSYLTGEIVQNAIVELDIDKGVTTGFIRLYTIGAIKSKLPSWNYRAIESGDVSDNAAKAIAKLYESDVHTNSSSIPLI